MPVLKRIQGMGIPGNLGNRSFAMRIWLKPDRMRAYNISSEDVMKALAEQSVIGSPGRLGQATGKTSQSVEYVLTYHGTLQQAGAVREHHSEGQRPTAKSCGSRTSPRSNWARSSSTSTRTSTAIRRLHRPQAEPRLQRRRRHRGNQGGTRDRSRRRRSLPAWTTSSPTTSPSSWTPPSRRCCTPCSRRSSWCRWWSTCSSGTCGPR